ncbi:MAG TPA: hypothetical protein VK487_01890 [Candidatus Bathyarchaeia archaeon]|nr:hypothetical protein [Candidatus Bathyarchaeia archaeon]
MGQKTIAWFMIGLVVYLALGIFTSGLPLSSPVSSLVPSGLVSSLVFPGEGVSSLVPPGQIVVVAPRLVLVVTPGFVLSVRSGLVLLVPPGQVLLVPSGQVLVSGTEGSCVMGPSPGTDTIYFDSVNQTIGADRTALAINGHYSVFLVAGLSYYAFVDQNPPIANRSALVYWQPYSWKLDVPLGVTIFTGNFWEF